MTMDKYELQKLRDLPIEGVAERLGLQVSRHKCLCPFHEDTHPSMSFKVSRNTCRCFVCMTQSMGPIDLVMRYLKKDFLEACKWLSDGSWLTVNGSGCDKPQTSYISHQPSFDASRYEKYFERPWLSPEARRFLFDERKLDPRVVRWCRLTSWKDRYGTPWLQIPYYNREGKLIGVQNRRLRNENDNENENHEPRFRFPSGSECGIYNLPVLNMLKPGEELWITEGCSDCWAMLSSGHKAVAIPSATLLTKKDKDVLSGFQVSSTSEAAEPITGFRFHMWPDADVPGERLFLQLKEVLPNLVRHQLPNNCKDFSEFYLLKK